MLRVFTDFDGPIMDVAERYYQVYLAGLEEVKEVDQPLMVLSKAEFWRLKRSQIPERQIGTLSGLHDDQARRFAQFRRDTVHNLAYLKYDCLLPGTQAALQALQGLADDLVVITMRRDQALNGAIAQHHLASFFIPKNRYYLPDDYVKSHDVVEKTRLMGLALTELSPATETWIIGDTEADILAAQHHALPVIAVLSGIRDRDRLLLHQPNFIVENLQAAVDLLEKKRGVFEF